MKHYISHVNNSYYSGQRVNSKDVEVSERPGVPFFWSSGKWAKDDALDKKIFNDSILLQLETLDKKRIRPCAEIGDDNVTATDKQKAKDSLKLLNEQAAALRAQLIK